MGARCGCRRGCAEACDLVVGRDMAADARAAVSAGMTVLHGPRCHEGYPWHVCLKFDLVVALRPALFLDSMVW